MVVAKFDATANDEPNHPKLPVHGYPTLYFVTATGDGACCSQGPTLVFVSLGGAGGGHAARLCRNRRLRLLAYTAAKLLPADQTAA